MFGVAGVWPNMLARTNTLYPSEDWHLCLVHARSLQQSAHLRCVQNWAAHCQHLMWSGQKQKWHTHTHMKAPDRTTYKQVSRSFCDATSRTPGTHPCPRMTSGTGLGS